MNRTELEAFAREAVTGTKSQKALAELSNTLSKITVEASLNADLD